MKTAFVLLAICAAAVVAHTDQEKKVIVDTCITESGADRELVDKSLKDEWTTGNTALNCFTYCYLRELGLIDNFGNWKNDELNAYVAGQFSADKLSDVKATCVPASEASCYGAFLLAKCWSERRNA